MTSRPRRAKPNATGRNETQRFVALPHYMLRCEAWRTLSPNGKALLLDVWARHNGMNNGSIAYAIREAAGIGLSKSVAARAFCELEDLGFLRVHHTSTFNQKTKEARTWEVTAERCGDRPASRDFMRWKAPAEEISRSRQRDAQSPQRDTTRQLEISLPVSVPPAGP